MLDTHSEVSVVAEFGSYSMVCGIASRREVWLVCAGSMKSRIFLVAHVFHCIYCFIKARRKLRQMSFRSTDCSNQSPKQQMEPTADATAVLPFILLLALGFFIIGR